MRTVRAVFQQLRAVHPSIGEYKWTYVTGRQPLTAYCDLVDLFFDSPAAEFLSFKCIVIRHDHDRSGALDKVGRDLGFYKAYFTLLSWRLAPGSTNHIRLDRRSSPRADPEAELARCLNAAATRDMSSPFSVDSCRGVSSKAEDLIQLADVLCGLVGWAWNGQQSTCGAKPIFHKLVCKKLNRISIKCTTPASSKKFNVWQYTPHGR